ncbi:unnamed protein product [Orchesella dallaii]|uniref:Uncharacterized protein n=1 Tax=Orchesella dallaii TaxID=48710 RepID=A0ABP1RNY1_9HEXA
MEKFNIDAPVFVPKMGVPLNPYANEFIPLKTDQSFEKESSRFALNPEAKIFRPPVKLENVKLSPSRMGLNAGAAEFQPSKILRMVVSAEVKVLTDSKRAEEEVKVGKGELDGEQCEPGVWQYWRMSFRDGKDKKGRFFDSRTLSVDDVDWFYL